MLTHILSWSVIHSHMRACAHTHTWVMHLTHSLTHPPTPSIPCTHSLTHPLLQTLTNTHSLTDSLRCACVYSMLPALSVRSIGVWKLKVSLWTLKAYVGMEVIVPLTPDFGTRWSWVLSFMAWWLNLEEKHLWYSLSMGCVDHPVGWDVWERRRSFHYVGNWIGICQCTNCAVLLLLLAFSASWICYVIECVTSLNMLYHWMCWVIECVMSLNVFGYLNCKMIESDMYFGIKIKCLFVL